MGGIGSNPVSYETSAPLLPPYIAANNQRDKRNYANGDVVLVFLDERFVAAQKIAEQGEDERPQARAEAGVKREGAGVHAGESGGDGNQVADAGYEATGEGGDRAVLREESVGFVQ